jgi:uncharacterized membrane protein
MKPKANLSVTLTVHGVICYGYENFSGLVPPSILWRQSGIFWVDLFIYVMRIFTVLFVNCATAVRCGMNGVTVDTKL